MTNILFSSWQDLVLTIAALVFLASLLPSVMDARTRIPRRTSVPTAVGAWTQVVVFATLGLAFTALVTAGIACGWTFLAWKRTLR